MNLPMSFRELSNEEEMEAWLNSSAPDEEIDARVQYLQNLASMPFVYHYLEDTVTGFNNIRILEAGYIKVGKYTSQKGFLIVNEMIQEDGKLLGITYEVLDNTYFTLENGNDVMQIRYKATRKFVRTAGFFQGFDDVQTYYSTLYVVSHGRSVMILVNHETEDFEYFVRSVKFLDR